ncbi:MAG TPA: NUDIX domain-containing protein [Gemmatimonadales bacterium]|nr:NUDIX domain-containing protein [Gemmatimonadales bacterium]
MTSIRVSLVDAYLLRPAPAGLEALVLRRGPHGRCPGSWEAVHGHIEAEETPAEAAAREMLEETGLRPERLYNLSRVETFYQHSIDEVAMVPVFVGLAEAGAAVTIGPEHDGWEWLPVEEAAQRYSWPRERRAILDAAAILRGGDGGSIEDVLRVW